MRDGGIAGAHDDTNWQVRRVHGPSLLNARIRTVADDFVVHECLPSGLESGDGDTHLWVQLEKRERNTFDAAKALASCLGCPARDIGYSGLKDRMAVTRQWLSVPREYVGGDEPPLEHLRRLLKQESWLQVLATDWRGRKLRRGTHAANRFTIVLREVESAVSASTLEKQLQDRVAVLRERGFPNAFGPQRFGADGRNLRVARRWLRDGAKLPRPKGQRQRHERGLVLSAARAYLFNRVLDHRIAHGSWQTALDGEPLMLAGSNSRFVPTDIDATIARRLAEHDVSTSGPLVGGGDDGSLRACQECEQAVLATERDLCVGLTHAGVTASRRALRAQASDLELTPQSDATWQLRVTLDAGVYATSLLREIASVT